MARKRRGRLINGVLLLNKPAGMTSNDALQKAKRLFFAAKAGHTGALDPLATGVLPLCFGEATKFSQFLLEADKRYRSTFRFGVTTATGDADGEVLTEMATDILTREQVEAELTNFQGEIEQVPSMYSALKHKGQPLYKLAREGIEVEREARRVTIFEIKLLGFRPGPEAEADVEIHCSKGTYVRTIAEDLGYNLGCGAHVTVLHRSGAGPFMESETVTLDELTNERGEGRAETLDHHLLSTDAPVSELASVTLPESTGYYFSQGNPVMDGQVYRAGEEGDMVRVFVVKTKAAEKPQNVEQSDLVETPELENGDFLGVGQITDDGRLAPKRLVVRI